MPIVVIIGPSGAGKSSLVDRYLRDHPEASLHKTITTRPIRDDTDSSHRFVTDDEFDLAEKSGKLLNASSVFGFRYGLPELPKHPGGILFVMLRQQFVSVFKGRYTNACVIQIEAPVDVLLQRLVERGEAGRADKASLEDESSKGRSIADAVISTDVPFKQSYTEFEQRVNSLTDLGLI